MKVIQQFSLVTESHHDVLTVLLRLEQAIESARALLKVDLFRSHNPEPLKSLEHDYDLVLGNFGIDFLHRQDSASPGKQADPAAGPGTQEELGRYLPPAE
jgi:hypothetical protein